MSDTEDKVIWRTDLRKMLNNVQSDTVRKWIKAGKLPKPDVRLSGKTMGWRLSTLREAGINLG